MSATVLISFALLGLVSCGGDSKQNGACYYLCPHDIGTDSNSTLLECRQKACAYSVECTYIWTAPESWAQPGQEQIFYTDICFE